MGVIVVSIGMMLTTTLGLAVAKLAGLLAVWPWWVVAAPVWVPWSVVALAAFCLLVYMGLMRLQTLAP